MSDSANQIRPFVQSIRSGEHAILEFRTPQQRSLAIREFVQEGLHANERTLVIAHPDTPEVVQRMLADLEGFAEAISKGRLLVFPGRSFHESLGAPTRQSLTDLHRKLVDEAQREGLAGVRGCVDVTYYAEAGVPGGLERFEEAIGERFPFAFRLLCLLDTGKGASALHHRHTGGRSLRVE